MNRILKMFAALLFNGIAGATLAQTVGLSPVIGALGMNVLAAVIGQAAPSGSLRAGVYTEIWTGELVKALRGGLEGLSLIHI